MRSIIAATRLGVRPLRQRRCALVVVCATLVLGCERRPDATDATSKSTPPPAPAAPEAIDAALTAAEDYFHRRDLASAETILTRLIETAPDSYRGHELMGSVLYLEAVEDHAAGGEAHDGLYGRAHDHFRIAARLAEEADPFAAAGLHQSAGEIASVAGRTEEALEHFRSAGRLEPDVAKHPLYEGQMLLQLGRLDEAGAALERAVTLEADNAFTHASLATVALESGEPERALERIAEARRLDPGSLAIRLSHARILRGCNQPQTAVELLLSLDEEDRARHPVADEIARGFRMLGVHEAAAAAWEHCYRRHPDDWRAAVAAAHAWIEAGDAAAARWLYEQARLSAPPGAVEVSALERALGRAGSG